MVYARNESFVLGNVLDGECFSHYSYLNDHDEFKYNDVHHKDTIATVSKPQDCINHCKTVFEEQYTYANIQSNSCWCGNVPPYIKSANCTIPCSGDASKTCGGPSYSSNFYTVSNQSEYSRLQLPVKY